MSIGEDRWIGFENLNKSKGVLRAEFHNKRVTSHINMDEG